MPTLAGRVFDVEALRKLRETAGWCCALGAGTGTGAIGVLRTGGRRAVLGSRLCNGPCHHGVKEAGACRCDCYCLLIRYERGYAEDNPSAEQTFCYHATSFVPTSPIIAGPS